METESQTFKSKVTYWLYIPILGFVIFFLWQSVMEGKWISSILSAIVWCIVLMPMLLKTSYTIKGDILNVRSGFIINNDITIANIKSIKPTKSIMSAPALSFDRIEIFYNRYDSVVISPNNKQEFIEKLKQINPTIVSEV